MRKIGVKKLFVAILCILLTTSFIEPSFAYNTMMNNVRLPAATITYFPNNTPIIMGYINADNGAKIVGFFNSAGTYEFRTGYGNNKSGTITIQLRENDITGQILYEKTETFSNVSSDSLYVPLPSSPTGFNAVSRVCVVAIQKIQAYDSDSGWNNISFSFPNNQTGCGDWYFVNTDTIAADTLHVAQDARDAANTAATNAQNAYNAATTAATSASSAATNALNAYNNTIYDGESAAYWAYLAANNINVDDTPPVIQKLSGANGATCTTKSSFSVVVNASDNKPGQLQARAKVDSGSFGSWVNIPQSAISVTLSTSGAHTITVEVKDAAGNVSSATMIAFRI